MEGKKKEREKRIGEAESDEEKKKKKERNLQEKVEGVRDRLKSIKKNDKSNPYLDNCLKIKKTNNVISIA